MNFFKKILPRAVVQPELISLHIPKTAGTTFVEILKQMYGYHNVGSLHIQPIHQRTELLINYQHKTVNKSDFRVKTKVLHGHFHYPRIAEVIAPPTNTPVVTWLRHPVARAVSAYYYADSIYRNELSETHPRLNILNTIKRSLLEFSEHQGNRNLCSKYLEGVELADLHFVGVVEHFEEDMAYLAKMMGWKNYQIPHLNRTAERPPLGKVKREAILGWNLEDMELYEQALALRKTRKAR